MNPLAQTTIHAELDELARAHRALWLAELLPPGACVVWGGGATLASVLAADLRSVLLIEPRLGDREEASRRAGPGVTVRGPDELTDDTKADSIVVVVGTAGPADGLDVVLARTVSSTAALAVIVDPDREAEVTEALERAGRAPSVVRNELRIASTVALGAEAQIPVTCITALTGGAGPDASAVLVLAGLDPAPSVVLGADAGPAAWWSDTARLRETIERLDEELAASHVVRVRELEQARADADQRWHDAETRMAELLASTSWRVTAPLRRASDILKRR